jgi:hypothetical protein
MMVANVFAGAGSEDSASFRGLGQELPDVSGE